METLPPQKKFPFRKLILLAFVLFREDKYLNGGFYIGLTLILLSIILQTLRLRRQQLKPA